MTPGRFSSSDIPQFKLQLRIAMKARCPLRIVTKFLFVVILMAFAAPGLSPPPVQATVNIGGDGLSFRTVVDVKIQEEQIQHSETHHVESVYAPSAGSGSNCTTTMGAGGQCKFVISALHASATAQVAERIPHSEQQYRR